MITKKNCRQAVRVLGQLRAALGELDLAFGAVEGRDFSLVSEKKEELEKLFFNYQEFFLPSAWPEPYLEPRRLNRVELKEGYHEVDRIETGDTRGKQLQVLPDGKVLLGHTGNLGGVAEFEKKKGTWRCYPKSLPNDLIAPFHCYGDERIVGRSKEDGSIKKFVKRGGKWRSHQLIGPGISGRRSFNSAQVIKTDDVRQVITSSSEGAFLNEVDDPKGPGQFFEVNSPKILWRENQLQLVNTVDNRVAKRDILYYFESGRRWGFLQGAGLHAVPEDWGKMENAELLSDGRVVFLTETGIIGICNGAVKLVHEVSFSFFHRFQSLPDGRFLFSGGPLVILFTESKEGLWNFAYPVSANSNIRDFQLLPDGRIVTAEDDGRVVFYDGKKKEAKER